MQESKNSETNKWKCNKSPTGYHKPQDSHKNTIVACQCCGKIIPDE